MTEAKLTKYPRAGEAMHTFYGVRVGDNYSVHATGDTLLRRNIEWCVTHYPKGFDSDESHPAAEFTRYPSALAFAKRGKCDECAE